MAVGDSGAQKFRTIALPAAAGTPAQLDYDPVRESIQIIPAQDARVCFALTNAAAVVLFAATTDPREYWTIEAGNSWLFKGGPHNYSMFIERKAGAAVPIGSDGVRYRTLPTKDI